MFCATVGVVVVVIPSSFRIRHKFPRTRLINMVLVSELAIVVLLGLLSAMTIMFMFRRVLANAFLFQSFHCSSATVETIPHFISHHVEMNVRLRKDANPITYTQFSTNFTIDILSRLKVLWTSRTGARFAYRSRTAGASGERGGGGVGSTFSKKVTFDLFRCEVDALDTAEPCIDRLHRNST